LRLKEHRGEIVGEATWPAIIDRATHDRLVGLLGDESRRPANYGMPRVHPLAGLLYCGYCGGPLQFRRQKNEGLKMRPPNEVDLKTYREVTRELDKVHEANQDRP
jgi:hypothetical protein